MKTNQFVTPRIAEGQIAPQIGAPDAEERVRRVARVVFEAVNLEPVLELELEIAREAVEHARAGLRRIRGQQDRTRLFVSFSAADPQAGRNAVESTLGKFGLAILIAAFATVPAIATMLIAEAGKIALVADQPVFGLIFGVTALVAILASIELRDLLGSDSARQRFDWGLLMATIAAFLCWIVTLSLAAYPAGPGGTETPLAGSGLDWSTPAADVPAGDADASVGFELPMWLLFVVTGVLDLLAAPTLHRFALKRLTPEPLKRTAPDAEQDYLREQETPPQEDELKVAVDHFRHLSTTHEAWLAARSACEDNAVSMLRRMTAAAQIAYAAPEPPNGTPSRRNGGKQQADFNASLAR